MERIAALPASTTPLLHWDAELLRKAAAESERRIAEGRARPLEGLPVVVKDNFVVDGMPTTAGSSNPTAVPARESSFITGLREAGAIPFAKANMTEYALRGHGRNPHFGDVLAPGADGYNAGGSSSGSAAAVALGIAAFSVGTDTAGSVRMPAASCGVVGYKPAHGTWPMDGIVPLSRTCDHIGLLTARVDELEFLLVGIGEEVAPRTADFNLVHPGPETLDPIHPEVGSAFERVRVGIGSKECADLVDRDFLDRCFASYEAIRSREAWLDIGRAKADRLEDLGPEVAEIFEAFSQVTDETYREALDARESLRQGFIERLGDDVLMLPTMQIPAPPQDTWEVELGGTVMPLHRAMTRYSLPFSLIGVPAVAIPTLPLNDGLTASLQLVCSPGRVDALLAAAAEIESVVAELSR